MRRVTLIILGLLLLAVVAVGCDDPGNKSAQQSESEVQQDNYTKLVAQTPAHTMDVSPTRDTINFWIDTWGKEKGKLAYVYLLSANGQYLGYYVFEGLPVNYCAALTPTYRVYSSSNGNLITPAPSIDGVYYSGGQCNTFYGKDAVSGSYIEYTVGSGINVLLYDQPLNRPNVEPLGIATVESVK